MQNEYAIPQYHNANRWKDLCCCNVSSTCAPSVGGNVLVGQGTFWQGMFRQGYHKFTVIHGHFTVIYSRLQSFTVIYGILRSFTVIYGLFTVSYGQLWLFKVVYSRLRLFTVVDGCLQSFTVVDSRLQ